MSNKKQTAVDWLIDKIKEARSFCDDPSMEMEIRHTLEVLIKKGEQAKEMHKEEIIEFTDNYVDNCVIPNENMAIPTIMDVPQYYKETYETSN